MIFLSSLSRRSFEIGGLTNMISTAGTMRTPSLQEGSSFWQTTAFRLKTRSWRICSCRSDGKRSRMRPIVCAALEAWIVPNTRCPVSAAMRPASNETWSRISPTRITSGFWRTICLRADRKSGTSIPISRWFTNDFASRNRYSIGSSIVIMWTFRDSLTNCRMLASVVDFPCPVGPARTMSPWR